MKFIRISSLILFSLFSKNGFAEDSKFTDDSNLNINLKNFYFNRDFRNGDSNPSGMNKFIPIEEREGYRAEWAQGVISNFESGFTQGAIQFGFDAFSLIGVKLYSDPFKTGTNLLETDEFGNASDVYMEVGGSLKIKYNDTILTYGNQFPNIPVISTSTVRLLPSVSTGVTIKDSSFQKLVLNAGYFYSLNPIDSTNSISAFTTDYAAGIKGDSVSFLGGNYSVNKNSEISIYYSELEDVWSQTYVGAKHGMDMKTDNHRLNFSLVGFNNNDTGKKLGGEINSTIGSALLGYKFDKHTISLGYQQVFGNEPFDWIGFSSIGGNISILNAGQFSTFSEAKEKSLQLKYDLNFKDIGIPGLTFMARYIYGWDFDNSHSKNQFYTKRYVYDPALNNKHWERDIQVAYNFQSGFAKGLDIKLRQATHRAITGYRYNDIDEIRFIIEYPMSF